MRNHPDFQFFNTYYKRNRRFFENEYVEGALNEEIYVQFLDCYGELTLAGKDIYMWDAETDGYIGFTQRMQIGALFSDAYDICANLLFTNNIYNQIGNKVFDLYPDLPIGDANERCYYNDALASFVYVILYLQDYLPENGIRFLKYIYNRQQDDKVFFPKMKALAMQKKSAQDNDYNVDFSDYIYPQYDFEFGPFDLMTLEEAKAFVDKAVSTPQAIRIVQAMYPKDMTLSDEWKQGLDKLLQEAKNSNKKRPKIFLKDISEPFYGFDKNLAPLEVPIEMQRAKTPVGEQSDISNSLLLTTKTKEIENLKKEIAEWKQRCKKAEMEYSNFMKGYDRLKEEKKVLTDTLAELMEKAPDDKNRIWVYDCNKRTQPVIISTLDHLIRMSKNDDKNVEYAPSTVGNLISYLTGISYEKTRQFVNVSVANTRNGTEIRDIEFALRQLGIKTTIK